MAAPRGKTPSCTAKYNKVVVEYYPILPRAYFVYHQV